MPRMKRSNAAKYAAAWWSTSERLAKVLQRGSRHGQELLVPRGTQCSRLHVSTAICATSRGGGHIGHRAARVWLRLEG